MSSVAYAPDAAQAPIYDSPPPAPFARVAAQYSLTFDRNRAALKSFRLTPMDVWVLAACFTCRDRETGVIFASIQTLADMSTASVVTVKRCLAKCTGPLGLMECAPQGIPGKRGGRGSSEYRFNESHSLWKILSIPVKKPVQRSYSKDQTDTLNRAPSITTTKTTPVTVPITRYSGPELRKKSIETPEPPKAAYPVYPEDSEILGETLRYWGIADFAVKTCAAILGELPPEYGGAPPLLREILHGRPPWHNWRRIESPAAYIRQIAKNEATRWSYTT